MKTTSSKPSPIIVEAIHLKNNLSSDFDFKYTISFAFTREPHRYAAKLAITNLKVLPKTMLNACEFSKNAGAGSQIVI